MDKRIYTNAALSYFFLGFLFLLAKRNPLYAHEYIRFHAKKATRLHLVFWVSALLYFSFLSPLLFSVPHFGDWLKLGGDILFLSSFTCFILFQAHKAFSGSSISDFSSSQETINTFWLKSFSAQHIPEAQKVLFLASGIPYLGLFFEERFAVPMARFWAFFGGIMAILFSVLFLVSPLWAFYIFLPYVIFMVFIGINLFVRNQFLLPPQLFQAPTLDELMIAMRAWLWYFWGVVLMLFKKKYAPIDVYKKVLIAQQQMEKQKIVTHPTAPNLFLKILAIMPVLNIWTLLIIKKYPAYHRYFLQHIALSFLYIANAFVFTFFYGCFYFLLFCSIYLFSRSFSSPHVRCVFVDEILSLGLLFLRNIFGVFHFLSQKKKASYSEHLKVGE